MLFRKGDYSNSEYKQRFKEHIEVTKAYKGGFLFEQNPGRYNTGYRDSGTERGERRERG